MRLHITSSRISATLLVSLLAVASLAQPAQSAANPPAHDPDAMDTTTTDASSPAPRMTPEELALLDRYLTSVRAQPVHKIDTRNAAAGQGVTFQLSDDATLANGTPLPRGTRLTGRILRAQPYQKDSSAAVLSIGIDRAVLSNGTAIPIRCVLRALAPAPGLKIAGPDASQHGSRASIGSMAAGPVTPATPTIPGGPAVGSAPVGAGSISTDAAGTPIGDPGVGDRDRNALGATTAAASADPSQPVAQAGVDLHDTAHPTGLPGVMLSGASLAGVSGTLSAFDHNITLAPGTQLTLGLISR